MLEMDKQQLSLRFCRYFENGMRQLGYRKLLNYHPNPNRLFAIRNPILLPPNFSIFDQFLSLN